MKHAVLALVLVACGSHRDGVAPDAGGDDGGGTDGDTTVDGDVTPDAAAVDPALCAVGPADGCCPLLRYGGTDPDCPSLACPHLVPSAPILLEDHQNNGWRGATALTWTGTELVLARVENVQSQQDNGQDFIVERRDAAGALTFGPVFTRRVGTFGYTGGHTSLAYDETTQSLLFVDSTSQSFRATLASIDGAIAWEKPAYSTCNGIDGIASALVRDGALMVAGEQYTCAGSTGNPALAMFDPGGASPSSVMTFADGPTPQYSWEAGVACDLDCDHLFVAWNRGAQSVRARMYDVQAQSAAPAVELVGNLQTYVDHQGVASDGTAFFHYMALQASSGTTRSFRLFVPGTGYVGTPVTMTGERGLPPSVIWTGAGWMVAVASFTLSTSTAFPQDRTAYHVDLYHFAPDGTLREQWRNEAEPGFHPQLVWAGGRIAMTWVRVVDNDAREDRYLRYFDCP